MKRLYIDSDNISVIYVLYSQYMMYLLCRNLSSILLGFVFINFSLFIMTRNLYCASVVIFICYIYFSSGFSKQSRKAGEQAIRYLDLLMSASSISDTAFSEALNELNKSNVMVHSALLRGIRIFVMTSPWLAPLTITQARGKLTLYEKLVIRLAGGLPVVNTNMEIKILLNSTNYQITLNFD
ncbi:hypothetical protein B0C18_004564 [Salmonella enterica]|nr:hypothetical protein [Salmonella enterica]